MRDPHVARLIYTLSTAPDLRFDSPPERWETDAFKLHLEAGTANLEIKEHFASVSDARERVEPFLRAWEVRAMLAEAPRRMQFDFRDSEVIDRDPPPPPPDGSVVVEPLTGGLSLSGHVAAVFISAKYPPPPVDFVLSPETEALWVRYRAYLDGREPLQAMGFYCLTALEDAAGGRSKAAAKFMIDAAVLRKLGELTSTRGNATTARKASAASSPLTEAEITWVKSVIRIIVLRLGKMAAKPSAILSNLTMADLSKVLDEGHGVHFD